MMYQCLFVALTLISNIFPFKIPNGYKHPDEFHINMTSEERMVVTGRVLIDPSLNKAQKIEKVGNLTSDYVNKEPHSFELLKQLVELKKWLDDRLEKAEEKVKSIHEKKFKLLFALKGSPLYLKLTHKANKIKSTLNKQEREEEETIEKEFHAKAAELKIHETIDLFLEKNS
ncbi:hypothetical protein RB195_021471 [Necator americanus]|uniref:Uncharacterized protein n=1 Tax=Necator americanus TaxID=51031 RepID=A0ABR1EC92_NECAM